MIAGEGEWSTLGFWYMCVHTAAVSDEGVNVLSGEWSGADFTEGK